MYLSNRLPQANYEGRRRLANQKLNRSVNSKLQSISASIPGELEPHFNSEGVTQKASKHK
jgi:hypothetical protein